MVGRDSIPPAAITAAYEPPSFVKSALAPGEQGSAFWQEVSALHDNNALLPADHLRSSLSRIGSAVAVITTMHVLLVFSIRSARRVVSKKTDNDRNENDEKSALPHVPVSDWKTAYQITNLAVNLALGLLGIYHFFHTITAPSQTPPSQRVEGWENMSIFGELQIAFQLWAIPVGVFLVNEHGAMLAHHFCVIVVGSMSAFFTNGFRYFTPFFYGLIEISSVPLAVLNAFKGDPQLAQRFPMMNQTIRLIFAISFLTVRFVMWMPQITDYLRVAAMLFFTCRSTKCRVGCAMSWLSAVALTFLQLLWATKIVQGLVKIVTGGYAKEEKREKKDV